ncbi:hypothetical protein KB559_10855 [Paenibacillus sp. Marseille-P2973]|uniref:hypothetical protein n=1 Tax=Paenibacillus sp. Marseille-P2973 TaxID=1871032 RepID=UPI001B3959C1|nr:hypothetical protein [Paenibacillus sp. Marseille-P2973]MBQ4899336.1 hypothetical protein [Paenibacillus sp. Marseille-P2973]
MKQPIIQYEPKKHDTYFAGFVLKHYEYNSYFQSWKYAKEAGQANTFEQGERLFRLMLETEYYKFIEPE